MSSFQEIAGVTHLKMGIYGEAGSGKTRTAAEVASGLAVYVESMGLPRPRTLFLDTEFGSDWIRPVFNKAGVKLAARKTRAFVDLMDSVRIAEKEQAVLIVDSITHFWQEVQAAYLKSKESRTGRKQPKLQFEDYAVIKPMWGEFTGLYLNSACHIILCGRAASIYEYQDNERGDRKELITVGSRMGAEKGMSYEPSLNVEMRAELSPAKNKKSRIVIKGLVVKDRADLLNGQEFVKPNFQTFLPHIQLLNIGGASEVIDLSRSSSSLFPKDGGDDRSFERKVVLAEIQDLLTSKHPGRSAEAIKTKTELVKAHFGETWLKIEKRFSLEDLRSGYDAMHVALEGSHSKYATPELDDVIPDDGGGTSAGMVA